MQFSKSPEQSKSFPRLLLEDRAVFVHQGFLNNRSVTFQQNNILQQLDDITRPVTKANAKL